MSRILPPGTKIPLTGITKKYFDENIQSDVECIIHELPWSGEKGYNVKGTIKVGNGPAIEIDAEAYKSGPTYRKLKSTVAGYAQTLDDTLYEKTGLRLAEVLVYSTDKIVREYLTANHIPYEEMDGVYMDFTFDNGFCLDHEDA